MRMLTGQALGLAFFLGTILPFVLITHVGGYGWAVGVTAYGALCWLVGGELGYRWPSR